MCDRLESAKPFGESDGTQITSSLLDTSFSFLVLGDFWDDFLEPRDCDKAFFIGDSSVNSLPSFTTHSRCLEGSALFLTTELPSNVKIVLNNRQNYITLKITYFIFLRETV